MPPTQHGMPAAWHSVVNLHGDRQPADAARLDVDVAAALQADRLLGLPQAADAFVEADRRANLRLQCRVIDQVVVRQRLLDHRQVQLIDLAEQRRVRRADSRCCSRCERCARDAAGERPAASAGPSRDGI